jgi:hypothetical protein
MVYGKITLKWNLKERVWGCGLNLWRSEWESVKWNL